MSLTEVEVVFESFAVGDAAFELEFADILFGRS